jgi:MoaA/NifB/PqqE/SkfB family radical SAM enzyme
MTLEQSIEKLKSKFSVVDVINLDQYHALEDYKRKNWLEKVLLSVYKPEYQNNERIIFTLTQGDIYNTVDANYGMIIQNLQRHLNQIDISNYFVILLTTDITIKQSYDRWFTMLSSDAIPIDIIVYNEVIKNKILIESKESYQYNSATPIKISMESLDDQEKFLLTESKTFCMYPWIHLHAYPTGEAYPCCQAEMQHPVGSLRQHTIKEIWNQDAMKLIRRNMLENKSVNACTKCYEQEASGFLSGRKSANKHHGHLVDRVHQTQEDGHLDTFQLTYWDIRFSNLCNLRCRSCGHIFSSSWYQDQVKLAGPEWKLSHKPLFYAGKFETDAWEQLIEHIDHVEQIYFAGGEPLMMDEHYRILEELERRNKFDVRLIYNSNFTQTKLKDRTVFDYWRKFKSVSVGASLDDMGPRAEYIRKGTDWDTVEYNRQQMIKICPNVDFYISATLSIMNAWHLPDFHKAWVEKGLIQPQDFNINILQDPAHYRIDIAPMKYKQRVRLKFEEHIEWLRPRDKLQRATVGFESAINFMMSSDNTHLIDTFWRKTYELDSIRKENLLAVIPELEALK